MRVGGQITWLLALKHFAITKVHGKYWYASNVPRGATKLNVRGRELWLRHLIVR